MPIDLCSPQEFLNNNCNIKKIGGVGEFLASRSFFFKISREILFMLQPGDKAPVFSLLDQDDVPASLEDFRGKWVVLYFYPKDNTSG